MWLGLTVLTRSATPPSRVFGLLALSLVAWSSSVIVERLSTSVSAIQAAHGIEELAAAIVVPATAHFALLIATQGYPSRGRRRALALAYVANVAFAIPGIVNPGAPIAIAPPQLSPGLVPGALLGWSWIAARLATLLASAWWLLDAVRRSKREAPLRRQLGITLATVAVGALGGIIRLLSVISATDPWIGVSLVTLAMVLSASVVFSGGIFFLPDVAGRAFSRSLGLGLGLFLLVGALLVVDATSRAVVGLDLPLATILALVIMVAIYEPASAWGRRHLAGRLPSAVARERLISALGGPALAAQPAGDGIQPALTRVAQALDLASAVVLRRDGSIAAVEGASPEVPAGPGIRLVVADELMGELRVSRGLSALPLGPGDQELLSLSASYLAAALRTGRREEEQVDALSILREERAGVERTAARLHDALVQRSMAAPGLRVSALGPLHAVRGEATVERWGGEKAGTRQAQALFAFLFDRGERGLEKDEALDLIWPDTDVERADLAFHRTLGGLRHTLDPAGGGRQAIRYHNDRYRMDPSVVAWSDVTAFLANIDGARAAADRGQGLHLLEEARALYRGDYLDDCPFYGDSIHVEERRTALRSRFVDLLLALGESYESAGDRLSAAAAFREAATASLDGCPPAERGLARLAAGA